MKKIYQLRKSAKNPFTKLSGKKAISISTGCLIVEQERITTIPRYIYKSTATKVVAAYLYLRNPQTLIDYCFTPFPEPQNIYTLLPSDLKVKQSCGCLQCVSPDHLIIEVKQEDSNW